MTRFRDNAAWFALLQAVIFFAVLPWMARDGGELAVFVIGGFVWLLIGWMVAPSDDRRGEER